MDQTAASKIRHAEKTLAWLVWLLVFLWIIYLAQPLLIEPERGNTTLRSKVNLAVLDALRLADIPLAVHHRIIQMGR
ncbi:MAG: hypothetical protein EXR35_05085 [Limnohabitans sp.]|nr:hypothetical protein [Limnohabitans sp.]